MPSGGAISLYIVIYDLKYPRTPHAAENPPHAADGGSGGYVQAASQIQFCGLDIEPNTNVITERPGVPLRSLCSSIRIL